MGSRFVSIGVAFVVLTYAGARAQSPVGSEFTYQGKLANAGVPANGPHDFQFALFDASAGGNQVGSTICVDGVQPVDGLFTVPLDFGVVFDGKQRFLQVAVREDATAANCSLNLGAYTSLSPRQPLTATPYAEFALAAPTPHALDAADGLPANAVFVDAVGNVGVGTTTPADSLHVATGNLLLGTNVGLTKQDSGGITRALLSFDPTDNTQLFAAPDKLLEFRTGTGGFTSVHAALTPTGRLGIGTIAPDVLVHLQTGDNGITGVITASNLLLERTSDNWLAFMSPINKLSGLAFSRPGSTSTELFHGAILYNESTLADAMQFRTGGNFTRMTIKGTGEIGIGTTTPAAHFHVLNGAASGASFLSTDAMGLEGGTSTGAAIALPANGVGQFRFGKPARSDAAKMQYVASTGGLSVLSDTSVGFGTDSGSGFATRMFVANDGKVGIGTTAPTGRLHVVDATGGNGSVVLPNNSISAAEILDEPGCAGTVHSSPDVQVTAVFPSPPQSVLSQSITAPAAGYVLAVATLGTHTVTTGAALCRWGLTTDTANIPADQMQITEYQPSNTSGSWGSPITLHRLFQVSAGTTTVHVMAQEIAANWEFDKAQLSLVYFPTTYGSAPSPVMDDGHHPTEGDGQEVGRTGDPNPAADYPRLLQEIAAEREALHAELAELRQLKADLERLRDASSGR